MQGLFKQDGKGGVRMKKYSHKQKEIYLWQNISPNQDKFSDFVEYSEEAERLIEPQAVKPDWLSSITRLGAASVRRSFATTIQKPIS